jgi:phage antirepressor YoqD-like protein
MIAITNESGHTEYLYQVGEVSKMLNLKDNQGKPLGRNKLFKCLRYNKVLLRDNTPSQFIINMGLGRLHVTNKRWKRYHLPVFTETGINYLQSGFESGKFTVQFDTTVSKKNKYIVQPNEVF